MARGMILNPLCLLFGPARNGDKKHSLSETNSKMSLENQCYWKVTFPFLGQKAYFQVVIMLVSGECKSHHQVGFHLMNMMGVCFQIRMVL